MLLKRLELIGFKSFATKTVLDFPAGIAAVVGPNGSGKTNIVDAVRWLLGEREAKNIRGAKAEDLIFAGTAQRARLGLAQATIVFDNSSRFFPVDYAEIAVSRRVSRDGVSEYAINDAPVRLRDIIDFFAKSRLGARGFSIIGQGDSDVFVRALPKERRVMLEEILGLRQYQIKKHDAERKLENTAINLDKVRAMIEEITPHLRLLKRQTVKWEKQGELKKNLRELEDQYFGFKLEQINGESRTLTPRLRELDGQLATRFVELKTLQDELKKVEAEQPSAAGQKESQQKQSVILAKRSELQRELGRLEAEVGFLAAQTQTKAKESELLVLLAEIKKQVATSLTESDIDNLKNSLRQLVERIDEVLNSGAKDLETKRQQLEQLRHKMAEELLLLDKELEGMRSRENALASQFSEFNQRFKKAFELMEDKKTAIAELNNQKNKILLDQERINIHLQEIENQIAQAGRRKEEFLTTAKEVVGLDVADAEKRIFRLRAELAGIGDIDESLIKEAQETENRFNFLSTQLKDLEKASVDLRQLIKELDQKIHDEFSGALKSINEEFNKYFRLMFGGGKAHMHLQKLEVEREMLEEEEVNLETVTSEGDISSFAKASEDVEHKFDHGGIDMELTIPHKRISGLDMLSGGERSLVSIAALFALISVSPPPFLVLDEIDAALDENNTKRFANLIKSFSQKTQFLLVTHNRATMEVADILYGVTMAEDGTSRILSLKLE